MSVTMTKESELRLHWAELQELEQKVVELITTALKLAPGLERRDSLVVIGSFRARIAGMKRSELARASTMHKLKSAPASNTTLEEAVPMHTDAV
jgi:hypothetical protein